MAFGIDTTIPQTLTFEQIEQQMLNGVLGGIHHKFCAERRVETKVDHCVLVAKLLLDQIRAETKGEARSADKDDLFALCLIQSLVLILECRQIGFPILIGKLLRKSNQQGEG